LEKFSAFKIWNLKVGKENNLLYINSENKFGAFKIFFSIYINMTCVKCKGKEKQLLTISGEQYCRVCYFDKMMLELNRANIDKNTELRKRIPDCGPECRCMKRNVRNKVAKQ